MSLVKTEIAHYVRITPPQTNDADIEPGKGAYCFVIDVSFVPHWLFNVVLLGVSLAYS